ncbi:PAC2 family protein [Pseudoclavibacter sp. CFCC 13796]|uniref:proteasome assembly chaperone family protein n=1 Tax=Pseudoclavibacter sp. CFCC 13796 TaxID=2615179 RepID=UPI00130188EB|nr:PAC2 family protein [Pseudoclavibacter sp. CFCC 13796]KAB1661729.1 PAC2 family protein [Pseudoclavibacter sp. CFCC 13796]
MSFRHPLYTLRAQLQDLPRGIPLVAALKGYADAGSVVEVFTENLMSRLQPETIVEFDPDDLLDYRSRRPVAQLVVDHITEITVPSLTLELVHDQTGAPFYLLRGFEPDFRWLAFLDDLVALLDDLEVSEVTWVHSIPMPVPHTRPIGTAVSGTRRDMIDQFGVWQPTTTMPASVLHMLENRLSEAGYEVTGFVMLTPHYLAETECPPAAVAATERVAVATGLALPTDELRDQAKEFLTKLDEQVSESDELQTMVQNLEERHDEYLASRAPTLDQTDVPSADEIGAEFESFLARHQDSGKRSNDGDGSDNGLPPIV